jgi:hypothetical protein
VKFFTTFTGEWMLFTDYARQVIPCIRIVLPKKHGMLWHSCICFTLHVYFSYIKEEVRVDA